MSNLNMFQVTRTAIDTLYFVGIYDITDELSPDATRVFENIIRLHNQILFDDCGCLSRTQAKVVIRENDILGIYSEFSIKPNYIRICIQFKGLFFTQDNALNMARFYISSLMEKLSITYRITRIDIAKDLLTTVAKVFPQKALNGTSESVLFNFKYRISNFANIKYKQPLITGYTLSSSRFEICVYDKKYEVSRQRNPKKITYYQQYFSLFPEESPITRFELRLKQETCFRLNEVFLNYSIDEATVCRHAYTLFSKKHSLKRRPNGSREKDIRRWPVDFSWKYLFELQSCSNLDIKPPSEPIFTPLNATIDQIYRKLAELCVHEGLSESELLSKLRPDGIEPFVEGIKTRQQRHKRTEHYLKEVRFKAKESQRKNRQIDGGSISSPSKRKQRPQNATKTPLKIPYIATNKVHSSSENTKENEVSNG